MKQLGSFIALGCNRLSSVRPQLSETFTDSLLLIVFSFRRCLPVTTVFPHAVWAQPHCDADFLNSAGVTVAGKAFSSQKRTHYPFPNNQTKHTPVLFSLKDVGGRSLQVQHWGSVLTDNFGEIPQLSLIFMVMFPLDIWLLMVTVDSSAFTKFNSFVYVFVLWPFLLL